MNVGVVGLGTMGFPMAQKVLAAGFETHVWNRTSERAKPLEQDGAVLDASPAAVASSSAVVLSSLKDDAAVREVLLDPGGIADALPEASVHCDTSTISPRLARELADAYREKGKLFVHAPVLGSRKQVQGGALLIFASGPAAAIDRAEPVLKVIGQRLWRFPQSDRAAALKLACNMLIASMIGGLSQSLVFGAKLEVPPELLLEVIQSSSLASPMYGSKGRQILDRNWQANFFVDNLIKDTALALEAGKEGGVPLPLLSLMQQLLVEASAKGYGKEDYSAVSNVLADHAGVEIIGDGGAG